MSEYIVWISLAIFGVLAMCNTRTAFFLLPLTFIATNLRLNIKGIPVSFTEVAIWIVIAGFVLQMLRSGTFRKNIGKISLSYKEPLFWVISFLLVGTISLFFVPQQTLFETGIASHPLQVFESMKIALGIWKGWLIPCVLFVFLASVFVKTQDDTKKLLKMYVISAGVLVLIGLIWRFVLGHADTLDGRFGGIFVSANYLVFYIAPAFILSVQRLYELFLKKKFELSQVLLFVLLLVGLVLARSYASWIILFLLGIGTIFMYVSKKNKIISLVVLLCLFVGAVAFEMNSEKGKTFFDTVERTSTSVRLEVYKISLELLKRKPLTGIGMGQYEAQYMVNSTEILGKNPYEWVMIHPHNLYLSMWLSLGILGAIWIVGLVSMLGYRLFQAKNIVLFLPLLYILLHGFVDTPFWKMDAMLVFFLLLFCLFFETKALAKPTRLK